VDLTQSDEIAGAIRTRHIQTPIDRALVFPADTPEDAVARELAARDFDTAPVTINDEVMGFVHAADLDPQATGSLASVVRRITARTVVAGDSPLASLMRWLRDNRFLFVVEGRDIVGLVTPSDLNKQPARTYFYLLVAGLELSLADLIRGYFPDQTDALRRLPTERQTTVNALLAEEKDDDVAADTVAAMNLTDLLTVVKQTQELRQRFGDYSKNRWQHKVCRPVIDLRHDVMHSVRTLATDGTASLDRLVALDELLRRLISS
jgi:hypothetical protein